MLMLTALLTAEAAADAMLETAEPAALVALAAAEQPAPEAATARAGPDWMGLQPGSLSNRAVATVVSAAHWSQAESLFSLTFSAPKHCFI